MGFRHGDAKLALSVEISYTSLQPVPRLCAAGTADIGIIPAAAYTTVPDLVIIPKVAIAARSAVQSILLVTKLPVDALWSQVRSVALDTSSMTSVALTKILFAKWLGGARDYQPMAPDLDAMLAACDAALLIGDPALRVDRTRYQTTDLAEAWQARTGKSFVFAFWAVRKQALAHATRRRSPRFQKSRDHGLAPKNLETIAQEWALASASCRGTVRDDLTHNIHYYLDPPCLEGLELYYRLAAKWSPANRARASVHLID